MSEQPAWARIEADLRARILAGEWPPGTRLPTRSQLAAAYQTSLEPVRAALLRLEIAGLIERRQGGAALVVDRTQATGE